MSDARALTKNVLCAPPPPIAQLPPKRGFAKTTINRNLYEIERNNFLTLLSVVFLHKIYI